MSRKSRSGNAPLASEKAARKTRRDRIGIVMIVVMTIFVAAFLYWQHINQPVLIVDKETWCPAEKDIPAQVTILIDQTDALNDTQVRSVKAKILDLIIGNKPLGLPGLPKYGRVELYEMTGSVDVAKPILRLCNPGDGSDVSELTGNPVLAERRWRQRFEEPFNEALDRTLLIGEADNSPILETLQAVNIETTGGLRNSTRLEWRRLVIVSDMLQHTDFTLYKGIPKVTDFTKTEYFRKVYSDLSGSGVTVLLLRRPAQVDLGAQKFQDFWANLFDVFKVEPNQFKWEPVEG